MKIGAGAKRALTGAGAVLVAGALTGLGWSASGLVASRQPATVTRTLVGSDVQLASAAAATPPATPPTTAAVARAHPDTATRSRRTFTPSPTTTAPHAPSSAPATTAASAPPTASVPAAPAPTNPPPPTSVPSDDNCVTARTYLASHAAPGFTIVCPGNALGHQAMTCVNVAGVCPGAEEIVIAVPCPASWMNEASNSWVLTGRRAGSIDPYGSCP